MADKTLTPSRIALGASALIAVAAIGVATLRGGPEAPPAPPPPSAAGAPGQAPDVAAMIPQLEERLRGNTTDANGWRLLGWANFETGRYQQSADAYAKATSIDPARADYWSALGEATVMAEKVGVSPRAELAFRKALQVDPKDARARYFLAMKKDLGGDHKGAIDDWIAMLKDGPANAPWARDVRQLVQDVAAKNGVDIAGRLPPPPPSSGPSQEQVQAAAQMTPEQQQAMIRQMVDRLAARLKASPRDGEGWVRLMQARAVLNDRAGASRALAEGRAALAGDQANLARLGEAAKALGLPGA
ncbi:tetratricopeptide repeat protein [Sphingomonas quercus]|uniref:Cytochrome c-type biogenesis protein H TPR domain-containing protein n=1 Tax=Sphingomonas quercus TaxID=2842451 RepID=A0ABS6BFU8_9SPHN|nr:hypothetical protein [Sphingomonas quercus]MBU3076356.1 hypothetical protein [Sphingomonas quercus]